MLSCIRELYYLTKLNYLPCHSRQRYQPQPGRFPILHKTHQCHPFRRPCQHRRIRLCQLRRPGWHHLPRHCRQHRQFRVFRQTLMVFSNFGVNHTSSSLTACSILANSSSLSRISSKSSTVT